jgi:ABC-2 type transport system permease protein
VAAFLLLVFLSSNIHTRVDLTSDKRFSLSAPTEKLLSGLEEVVRVQVFLTGSDLPADYRKLSLATQDLLSEFADASGGRVKVEVVNPLEGLSDTAQAMMLDSLARLGVTIDDAELPGKKDLAKIPVPSALVYYKGLKPFPVDLRASKTIYKPYSVISDKEEVDVEATRNAAEALLEFKFANAIDKMTRTRVPVIAYLVGNGEPIDLTVNDLGESLRNDYRLALFDLKKGFPDAQQVDALLIVKPTKAFTDDDKLKIDQYIMHGGKVFWFVDKLYAEMDSLMRNQAGFIAFDRDLKIDDVLFQYGVRINGNLVQDLNCSKLPIVNGQNPDGSPHWIRTPWPYYPFLFAHEENPVTRNLDKVLSIFPSSIDTVAAPGIRKTVLLATDTNSRTIAPPAMVQLNSVVFDTEDELSRLFPKSHLPVAVLLEGRFRSLFTNRLTGDLQDTMRKYQAPSFMTQAAAPTKQIVVSDADLVTNYVTKSTGPLPMGEIPLENYRFANREFFLNAVDYLVSNSGIFEARNKNFTLRVLDKNKVREQKMLWQLVNIVVPILVIILIGLAFQRWRSRAF